VKKHNRVITTDSRRSQQQLESNNLTGARDHQLHIK